MFDTHQPLSHIISPFQFTYCHCGKAAYLHQKRTCDRVLEANKKQAPLKSYSLEIRIDSVNQILKKKEKAK